MIQCEEKCECLIWKYSVKCKVLKNNLKFVLGY